VIVLPPSRSVMVELPDGSLLELDCRSDDGCLVNHWRDGDLVDSLSLELASEDEEQETHAAWHCRLMDDTGGWNP